MRAAALLARACPAHMLLLFVASASAQMYAAGVGKTTHLVSDAPRALSWLLDHLPVSHDTAGLNCTSQAGEFNETYCPCGQAGRVELWCTDCPPCPDCQPWGKHSGFGLHTISYNSSAPHIERPTPRPIGEISIATIEGHVTRKLKAAAAAGGYDAFLDFSTGLWVSDLDPYIREFADNSNTVALEWMDVINSKKYYSLMVQVANSFVVLEFMSATQTLLPSLRYSAPAPRFLFQKGQTPESLFPNLNATGRGVPIPRPARVSHYTTNLTRDAKYYSLVLGRDVSTVLQTAGVETLVIDFEDMAAAPNYTQLHLVQRAATDTRGGFTVAELEEAMNSMHTAAHTSDVCGWDQFNDFHYGVATKNWLPLSEVIPQIEALGYKYHTGTSTWHGADGELLTLFAMTPNGITIQLHNMARGTYVPSAPSVEGHDGLCSIGPPTCSK